MLSGHLTEALPTKTHFGKESVKKDMVRITDQIQRCITGNGHSLRRTYLLLKTSSSFFQAQIALRPSPIIESHNLSCFITEKQ